MQDYDFGALQHTGPLMHSIETQEDELAYLQFPCNEEFDKMNGLGLQFPDALSLDSLQWPYMPTLPIDNNEQFALDQPIDQMTSHRSSIPQYVPARRAMHSHSISQQSNMSFPIDMASNMSTASPSLSSTTTPPHVGPLDYLSPWPTPELEPTTLADINSWMPLEHIQSASSIASSVATPPPSSYHSRSTSLESVPQYQPAPAQKEKPQCWEHGCNGRTFSTYGNYKRHCKERSDKRPQRKCPRCGALFSRTTARNQHLAKNACNRIRRYSNGRQRPDFTIKTE